MTDWTRKLVHDKQGLPFYVGVRDGLMIDWEIRNLRGEALPEEEYAQLFLGDGPA